MVTYRLACSISQQINFLCQECCRLGPHFPVMLFVPVALGRLSQNQVGTVMSSANVARQRQPPISSVLIHAQHALKHCCRACASSRYDTCRFACQGA